MIYIPPWLALAQEEARNGVVELPGGAHNPRIIEYGQAVDLFVTSDEIPWCSNFVNWLFWQLDMKRTRSARARSWLETGARLTSPALGCIAICSRGPSPQPGPEVIEAPGHVTLFTDLPEPGMFSGLGGNQSNRVCERNYPLASVLGWRWPEGELP